MEQKVYTASTDRFMICPACGISQLHEAKQGMFRCNRCENTLCGTMLETLRQIAALPEVIGGHPCECGHPQMRLLPDGVFYCPACGSEVLPPRTAPVTGKPGWSEAYLCGWSDGLFGSDASFVHNAGLGRWEDATERLGYYQGHRAGKAARF